MTEPQAAARVAPRRGLRRTDLLLWEYSWTR
jgi:hypothetical protein